jgi:hypothetical protein
MNQRNFRPYLGHRLKPKKIKLPKMERHRLAIHHDLQAHEETMKYSIIRSAPTFSSTR